MTFKPTNFLKRKFYFETEGLYALTQFCKVRLLIEESFVHPSLEAKQLGYDWACYDKC